MQNDTALRDRNFSIDTTFVLFFLAVDFGTTLFSFGIDGVLSGITLSMLIVLPYFVNTLSEKPDFTPWVFGRIVISIFAIGLGILFRQSLGVVLPETFRFLPLTLLIVAAMTGCYIQFYSLLRFRLAK
ncbi:MAG: hypothetical protein ACR2M8_10015 [Pyrinomonadaceae bacterium]|jgi:hypothetical protein|nr:hypothetical protein [Blastocatellia bacterium]MDQ3220002.1 hypothetical protein [Acidobacteriota bacterium]MDQ3491346.1 hypothetical protein [Acidobacteriota bacterium]